MGELRTAAAEVRPGPTPGRKHPGQLRSALRHLLDRPGHAAAVASTLAVVVAVSLPASLLVRVRGWSPLRLAPGIVAPSPGPLDVGVPWGEGAVGPAGLRGEELAGFVILLALLVAALVIACVLNLAVLLMQHLASRRRELAIRRALGATRSRLRRDLLLQGTLLAAAGVVAGGAAGTLALCVLPDLMPAVLEPVGGYGPRAPVSAALAGPALAVVVVGYGLVGPEVAGGGTRLGGRRRSVAAGLSAALGPARWEKGLAALQCGLLVALLAGSGLLLRGSVRGGGRSLAMRDAGQLRIRDVWLRTGPKGPAPGPGPDPGDAVALASSGALLGLGTRAAILCRGCRRGPMAAPVMRIRPRIHAVGSGWFGLLGVPVIRGRVVCRADGGSPPPAAVNRAFAAQYGIGVGARLQLPGRRYADEWTRVVGVVENLQPPGLGSPATPEPAVYLPALRYPPSRATVVGRGDADPAAPLGSLPDPGGAAPEATEMKMGEVRHLTEKLAEHRQPEERLRDASVLLALLAWGTGLGGLAAVTALTLRRRWRELGIRRAVGARRRDVLALVFRDNLRTLGVGAAIGAILVTPEARALAHLLPGLRGVGPTLYYAAAVAAVGLTVAATTWIPVQGANRLAPREMIERE